MQARGPQSRSATRVSELRFQKINMKFVAALAALSIVAAVPATPTCPTTLKRNSYHCYPSGNSFFVCDNVRRKFTFSCGASFCDPSKPFNPSLGCSLNVPASPPPKGTPTKAPPKGTPASPPPPPKGTPAYPPPKGTQTPAKTSRPPKPTNPAPTCGPTSTQVACVPDKGSQFGTKWTQCVSFTPETSQTGKALLINVLAELNATARTSTRPQDAMSRVIKTCITDSAATCTS